MRKTGLFLQRQLGYDTKTHMTNDEWRTSLTSQGPEHERAIEELRIVLIRGLNASLSGWARRVGREFTSLIDDFAQETTLRVLDNIDSFRGESKFTTWAMKIGVRIALTELRRKRWQNFSLDQIMDMGSMPLPQSKKHYSDPETHVERKDAIDIVMNLIQQELTDKQRRAMLAIGVKGVALEEVARSMNTNRNALYKLMHDARLKLKSALEEKGLTVGELLETFETA
jgi:RNA polymerase sigma-70 factor, ECF subfamily